MIADNSVQYITGCTATCTVRMNATPQSTIPVRYTYKTIACDSLEYSTTLPDRMQLGVFLYSTGVGHGSVAWDQGITAHSVRASKKTWRLRECHVL